MEVLAKMELGMTTSASLKVRIRVVRRVTSVTTPSISGVWIQSPTVKGLSAMMAKPPKKLLAESLAARETVRPASPKLVIMPVMS